MLTGKYFYTSEGVKTQGSITTRSASDINVVGSQTYYSGYYPSNWTVSGLDTSDATAESKNIETGKTAYVNGTKITGTGSILSGIVRYQGSLGMLSNTARNLAACHNENYAFFGGGALNYSSDDPLNNSVSYYDSSLIKRSTSLSVARSEFAASNVGQYAVFGGGRDGSTNHSNVVDAFNASVSRSTNTLAYNRLWLGAATNNSYALFAGGMSSSNTVRINIDAFNVNMTRNNASLSQAKYNVSGTNIGNYALFGGGAIMTSPYYLNTVDAYNTSLSRSNPTALSVARLGASACHNENYALFGGAYNGNMDYLNTVDAYNASLTRSTPTPLSQPGGGAATNIGAYAIFGGGDWKRKQVVDVYDANLTRSNPVLLYTGRSSLAATNIGDYALFGGGIDESNITSSVVDAFYEI